MAAIQPKNTNDILVDSIGEKTGASGLTLVNDTTALTTLFTNTITERTVSNGVDIESVNFQNGFMELIDFAAPANPGGPGWRMYSDSADTELKARDNSGEVVNLSLLPVKYEFANGASVNNSLGSGTPTSVASVNLTGVESDELIFGLAELQGSNNSGSSRQFAGYIEIDAVQGRRVFGTDSTGSSNGQRETIPVIHVRTGLSGAITVELFFHQANGGTAFTQQSRLHVFQFKFRS